MVLTDLLLISLIAISMIAWRYQNSSITMDGVTYLQIARNLLSGEGLGWQALWASPGYSILVAGLSLLTGNSNLLGITPLVGACSYLMLLFALYGLGTAIFCRRTAIAAALIVACSPHILAIMSPPEPEMLFTCLLLAALFFLYKAVSCRSCILAIVAGVMFSLSWYARSEGLLIMMFTLLALLAVEIRNWRHSRILVLVPLTAMTFLLVASPYLLFLKKGYGTFVFSPKASYVMAWMKIGYGDSKKDELHNDEIWGLTADGKLRWQEPKGIRQLVAYLAEDPSKTAKVYLRNIGKQIPGRIPNNSGMERFPQVYPVYLVLAAFFGVLLSSGEAARSRLSVLLVPFSILLVLPVFTEGWWKYLVPYLPLLVLLAVHGTAATIDWLAGYCPGLTDRSKLIILGCITGLVTVRFIWALLPATVSLTAASGPVSENVKIRLQVQQEQQKAGQWAISEFGRGRRYSSPWSKLIYYLDGYWVAAPIANYGEQLSYLWRNKADFVVTELIGDLEQSTPLKPPPGMILAGTFKSADVPYTAVFFKVLRP